MAAKLEAEKEGIVVPMTLEDYCQKPKKKPSNQDPPVSTLTLRLGLIYSAVGTVAVTTDSMSEGTSSHRVFIGRTESQFRQFC